MRASLYSGVFGEDVRKRSMARLSTSHNRMPCVAL
jgi:hypothetical protein